MVEKLKNNIEEILRKRGIEEKMEVKNEKRRIEKGKKEMLGEKSDEGKSLEEIEGISDEIEEERIKIVEIEEGKMKKDIVEVEKKKEVIENMKSIGINKDERKIEIDERISIKIKDMEEKKKDRMMELGKDEKGGIEKERDEGNEEENDRENVMGN